jgi:hypothetical protein
MELVHEFLADVEDKLIMQSVNMCFGPGLVCVCSGQYYRAPLKHLAGGVKLALIVKVNQSGLTF